jgi:hypothetical protein
MAATEVRLLARFFTLESDRMHLTSSVGRKQGDAQRPSCWRQRLDGQSRNSEKEQGIAA